MHVALRQRGNARQAMARLRLPAFFCMRITSFQPAGLFVGFHAFMGGRSSIGSFGLQVF
jgi:hypothetical protein